MTYKNTKIVYETGSLKGTYNESVIYNTTMYHYIKIIKHGKTFYFGNYALDKAVKIREALRRKYQRKYQNVQIFSTTKEMC